MPVGVYEKSPEHRRRLSEALKGKPGHARPCPEGCECGKHRGGGSRKCPSDCTCGRHSEFSPERLQRMSEGRSGVGDGWYISNDGHKYLTGMQGHPLAIGRGIVAEHRYVLYEEIGPGPHPCYWCGTPRDWGGQTGINVDHLDDDPLNNDPDNLVPSCCGCNRVGRRRLSRREGIV